ncbi:MAG TPA: PAS domain-containing sensor histidine kinase [Desulfuromonadaceae bacterium]
MTNGTTFIVTVERATNAEIARQADMFACSDMTRLLDCIPESILILNKERQVVFGNRALLDLLHPDDPADILGNRMGELVKCRNAGTTPDGCGASPFCKYCGSLNAVLSSVQGHGARTEECHLLVRHGSSEEALDLRVSASPFVVNNEPFTLLTLSNIADEQAKVFLERIFLHNTQKSALALAGFYDLLSRGGAEADQREYMLQRIGFLSQRLIDEINAQHQLMAAEQGTLVPAAKQIETLDFLKALVETHRYEAGYDRKQLLIDAGAQSVSMTIDEQLLGQVIGHMLENALEASHPGETVTIGCALHQGMVHFSVANPAYMPEQIRAQVFSRTISTESRGKGMGTYRMKYLTEHYLHGTITYVTSEEQGTTFTAAYPVTP